MVQIDQTFITRTGDLFPIAGSGVIESERAASQMLLVPKNKPMIEKELPLSGRFRSKQNDAKRSGNMDVLMRLIKHFSNARFKTMKTFAFAIFVLFGLPSMAHAQEFEIKKYDLNARINLPSHTVEVEARLQVVNLSAADLLDKLLLAGQDKPRLTFFLHPKTKVASLTVSGNSVPVRAAEDLRSNLLRVSTEINAAIASVREFEVAL
ncbi:MAG: hypothetical protein ABI882_13930, partial [Acidobacteriota bacterium]